MRICGRHFLNEEPSSDPTDVDYIPTIVDSKVGSEEKAILAADRQKRNQQRNKKRSSLPPALDAETPDEVEPQEEDDVFVQGEDTGANVGQAERVETLSARVRELESRVTDLTNELEQSRKRHISTDALKHSDKLVRFYTGLPNYNAFLGLFQYLEAKAQRLHVWRGQKAEEQRAEHGATGRRSAQRKGGRQLPLIDEFLAVLMRLRLGLLLEDICFRFGISSTYFSKLFTTWIVFLAKEMPLLFPWPSAEKVKFHTPPQFSRYPNTRIIIDCFELFIERPSALRVNCQMFSHYKNHSTFKALIGISPGGVVTFLSKLFTGRASDKFIVSHSGFLDLMEAGDNVMADRGFEIRDLLLVRRATLNIPPFLGQNRSQFSSKEVDDTRHIAALRIHVERAIARLKCFRIIRGVIPITLAPLANQIVTVCTFLTNFSDPLVSGDE